MSTTFAPSDTDSSQITVKLSEELSQDVAMTAGIPIDPNKPSQIGVFLNPISKHHEALVIVSTTDNTTQILHVAPNPATDAGWTVRKPFPKFSPVAEVAVGTTPDNSLHCFFLTNDGLYTSQLNADGITWSDPQLLNEHGKALSNLKITYSPQDKLLLYAKGYKDNIHYALVAYQKNNKFIDVALTNFASALSPDFALAIITDELWVIAANLSGQLLTYAGSLNRPDETHNSQRITDEVRRVVAGFRIHNPQTDRYATFAYLKEDGSLYMLCTDEKGKYKSSKRVGASEVKAHARQAAAHVDTHNIWSVYAVDESNTLWVYHQDPDKPWDNDEMPNWVPGIPLAKGITAVGTAATPTDVPSLFLIDANGELRLYVQDATTTMWRQVEVRQPEQGTYEVVRYRVEAAVTGEGGKPLAGHKVTLAVKEAASACQIFHMGCAVEITNAPTQLKTDAFGKLTFSLLPMGITAPAMVLTADAASVPIQPGCEVHEYLSGDKETLNPTNPGGGLPRFDDQGCALAVLAPGVDPELAKVVAQGVRGVARLGLGKPAPIGAVGFRLTLSAESPEFVSLVTQEQLDQELAELMSEGDGSLAADIWGDLARWAGDLWEGLKSGVIKLTKVVADFERKVVTLVIEIGGQIIRGLELVIKGLEQAGHCIVGVLSWVGAQISKVIDWLKAVFNLNHIWNTKNALQEAINKAVPTVKDDIDKAHEEARKWLDQAHKHVDELFDDARKKLGDTTIKKQLSSLPGWEGESVGPAKVSLSTNVHHNWVMDKVQSANIQISALAPFDSTDKSADTFKEVLDTFIENLKGIKNNLETAADSLYEALKNIITQPDDWKSKTVGDLLDFLQASIKLVLGVLKTILDGLAGLVTASLSLFQEALTKKLHLGPISALWEWIATAAGHPGDELTLAGLVALLAAVPVTIIYKLIKGADAQPFPNGTLPTVTTVATVQGDALAEDEVFKTFLLVAGILQAVYVLPATISDMLGELSPTWLSIVGVVWAAAVFVLAHAGLAWDEIKGTPAWVSMTIFAGTSLASVVLIPLAVVAFQKGWWDTVKYFLPLVLTLGGVGSLIWVIYQTATGDLKGVYAPASGILIALPGIASFLNFKPIRDPNPEFCIPVKVATNVVGYATGGALAVVVATQS